MTKNRIASTLLAIVSALTLAGPAAHADTQQDKLVSYVEHSGYVNKVKHFDFAFTWTKADGAVLQVPTLDEAISKCPVEDIDGHGYCEDDIRMHYELAYNHPTRRFHYALRTLAPLYPTCTAHRLMNCYTDRPGAQDTLNLDGTFYYLGRAYSATH